MQTYANDRFHRFAMTPSKTECCIYATEKACENAYANSECTQDAKGCYNPTSCKTDYATSASGCGTSGANGWSVGTKDGNGCGKCSPLTCTDPSSTSYNTVDACKTKLGAPTTTGIKSTTTGKYAGNTACYTCSCTCDSSTYKWEEGEVGGGTLSGQCCNGLYKTCTKNCPAAVTPPANATGVKTTCSDCGETTEIVTSWSCNTGYTKSGNTCVPAGCPTGTSTDYTDASKCGYPSTIGAKVVATDSVSGGKTCYECMCITSCKWTSSNKDTYGTISNVCCNGKYQTCTKNFPADVTVPTGATAKTTSYKACGETKNVITGWECTGQYVKNGNSCYDCATWKTRLSNALIAAQNSYGACCYTTGTTDKYGDHTNYQFTCRTGSGTSCTSNVYGSYNDGCMEYVIQESIRTEITSTDAEQQCVEMFNAVNQRIINHNRICPSSYQVSGTANSSQCGEVVMNGNRGRPVESLDGTSSCVIGKGQKGTGGSSSGGGGSSSGGSAIITPQVPSLDVEIRY